MNPIKFDALHLADRANPVINHKYGATAATKQLPEGTPLNSTAFVTVLNPMDAPTVAMLQALYSRSSMSILDRLDTLNAEGEEELHDKVQKFAVQYGHKSILDCGTITMFIEGVSFLAAKAIEDTPLFRGQETSSRYIDFSKAEVVVPTDATTQVQNLIQNSAKEMIAFYTDVYKMWCNNYVQEYSTQSGAVTIPDDVMRGIRAKAFDRARGFLPAGCRTQLSFHGSLRDVYTQIEHLINHPLAEVRRIAETMLSVFASKYKSAAWPVHIGKSAATTKHEYFHTLAFEEEYCDDLCRFGKSKLSSVQVCDFQPSPNRFSGHVVISYLNAPNSSRVNEMLATYRMFGSIDYGSYRDIHRHRNGTILMPMLRPHFFHEWYFEQMPEEMVNRFYEIVKPLQEQYQIEKQLSGVNVETFTALNLQYAIPMCVMVPLILQYDLTQMVYVSNLRATPHVHPTLRTIAFAMRDIVLKHCAESDIDAALLGLNTTYWENDEMDVARRGKHTVTDSEGKQID